MKIFIGTFNLAGQISDLKSCFSSLGIETLTATHGNPHPSDQGPMDYDFSKYKKYLFNHIRPTRLQIFLRNLFNKDAQIFRKAVRECDTFIFMWESYNWDHSDLEYLRKKGKKIIMIFCGNDVRWYYSQKQELEACGLASMQYLPNYDFTVNGLSKKLKYLRTSEKYADFIFSRHNQAQLQLRPFYRWNMMVPVEQMPYNPAQREHNPVIAHAPTSRVAKGTQQVLEVFERLKKEGVSFTPLLIENVNSAKAKEMYLSADMVVDQLIAPGSGKLATECMSMGKVVLGLMGYGKYDTDDTRPCPIVDVNTETLYETLKSLILNPEKRKEIALKGRPYVEKYLDTMIFCRQVVELLNGKEIPYDYHPTFFRDQFIPESTDAAKVYNSWSYFVKDTDWYKKFIVPGERAGLKFKPASGLQKLPRQAPFLKLHPGEYKQCTKCVLDTTATKIYFDENGVCNYCRNYENVMDLPLNSDPVIRKKRLDQIINRIKKQGEKNKYDCIIGISGGIDSTYLAYLAVEMGLRPLAVHFDNGWNSELAVKNIENIVTILGIDLYTHVTDWEEFKDMQLSYLKASVVDIEVPTDHLIYATLFKLAKEKNIPYILSGNNNATELVMPEGWTYKKNDKRNLLNIHEKFGKSKLNRFPTMGFYQRYLYDAKGIHAVELLNLLDYNKLEAKNIIIEKLKWRDYGGKHYESIFTRFYQGCILPQKFNIDKRKAHYSNLICSGQMTKEEALRELKDVSYPLKEQMADMEFVLKKFGLSPEEFDEIMKMPVVSHEFYGTESEFDAQHKLFRKLMDPLVRLLWQFRIFNAPYY